MNSPQAILRRVLGGGGGGGGGVGGGWGDTIQVDSAGRGRGAGGCISELMRDADSFRLSPAWPRTQLARQAVQADGAARTGENWSFAELSESAHSRGAIGRLLPRLAGAERFALPREVTGLGGTVPHYKNHSGQEAISDGAERQDSESARSAPPPKTEVKGCSCRLKEIQPLPVILSSSLADDARQNKDQRFATDKSNRFDEVCSVGVDRIQDESGRFSSHPRARTATSGALGRLHTLGGSGPGPETRGVSMVVYHKMSKSPLHSRSWSAHGLAQACLAAGSISDPNNPSPCQDSERKPDMR